MMPRKKTVPKNERTRTLPSYFMCMKKNKIKDPFMDAMKRAIQTFIFPRSI
jgi:hypothetical protein